MWVIEFDHREDNGPTLVGPFGREEHAQMHADDLATTYGPGWSAEYSILPLAPSVVSLLAMGPKNG